MAKLHGRRVQMVRFVGDDLINVSNSECGRQTVWAGLGGVVRPLTAAACR